ncbi:hypothetical protein [Dictyobacter formicarum]|uniref:Intracellular proteinase inhibitor BsuPI domain-containing protein n=1 Tax=Dictyobacter formicarum TaxID=2778368 RepID=A0ABQ3VHM3_9CHLR|nr:hypothetical protein [Dictyobacter formicarum]GHO85682.1 hypothetical protein KSZ_36880 [Dictyobacter formicarum]
MMSNNRSVIISIMILLCLSMLAACGNANQNSQKASQQPPQGPTKPTPVPRKRPPHRKILVDPTPTPQPNPQPGQTPTPGNPNPNTLQLAIDKTSYTRSDAITVTITNGLGHNIYLTTPRTSCTLVQLEMLANGIWNPVGRCVDVAATPTLQLPAGGTTRQIIQPQNSYGLRHSVTSWQPGTYRLSISYNPTYDPDTVGGTQNATSTIFTIT